MTKIYTSTRDTDPVQPLSPNRTLTDNDVDAVAKRVIDMIVERLSTPASKPVAQPSGPIAEPPKPLPQKMAYSLSDLSQELGISKASLYRFEALGLLKPLPYFRHKIFSKAEVERFLSGRAGETNWLERRRKKGGSTSTPDRP